MMDFDAAIEELSFHCGSHPSIHDPRWDSGFLQTLRPYRGHLDRDAWSRVIQCVDAVAGHIKEAPVIDRSIINSLWAICYYSRLWALEPDGMLRRNNLISEADQATLAEWLDDLSYRIACMLDGGCEPN